MAKKEADKLMIIRERIDRGAMVDQKAWKFVRDLNSFSEERLNSIALIDGRRSYSYRQLFRNWNRYAEVFAALGICGKNGSRVGKTGKVTVRKLKKGTYKVKVKVKAKGNANYKASAWKKVTFRVRVK